MCDLRPLRLFMRMSPWGEMDDVKKSTPGKCRDINPLTSTTVTLDWSRCYKCYSVLLNKTLGVTVMLFL